MSSNQMSKINLSGSLILSNRIPSLYGWTWDTEEMITIRPSIPVTLAVCFILSRRRFVKRKCPAGSASSSIDRLVNSHVLERATGVKVGKK